MQQQKDLIYAIFKTRWGWFGLLGGDNGLIRSCLPGLDKANTKSRLLAGIEGVKQAQSDFACITEDIKDYYEGTYVDFSKSVVDLTNLTAFQQAVLTALRSIKHGKKISYGNLAKKSGSPNAARAIGSVMAINPIPLIIPCHRVIRSDGTIGQFSATGGTQTKKCMLELEKSSF